MTHCMDCPGYFGSTGTCKDSDSPFFGMHMQPDDGCEYGRNLGQHYSKRDSYEEKQCQYCTRGRDSDGYCHKLGRYTENDDSCPYFSP